MKLIDFGFSDYIDDDGTGIGPWRVSCTMFKEKDENGVEKLVYDFDGTGMFHLFPGYTVHYSIVSP